MQLRTHRPTAGPVAAAAAALLLLGACADDAPDQDADLVETDGDSDLPRESDEVPQEPDTLEEQEFEEDVADEDEPPEGDG